MGRLSIPIICGGQLTLSRYKAQLTLNAPCISSSPIFSAPDQPYDLADEIMT
uniref:Uncharacterized protein n=1 Tax=Picea glauca TaxID=3330 RepID=A0A101LWF1_PICGL|nr:hypothetical protein ABT39_MTgene1678 [Picea glauca]